MNIKKPLNDKLLMLGWGVIALIIIASSSFWWPKYQIWSKSIQNKPTSPPVINDNRTPKEKCNEGRDAVANGTRDDPGYFCNEDGTETNTSGNCSYEGCVEDNIEQQQYEDYQTEQQQSSETRTTCIDVTSYDYNWDNDVKCTNPDGSVFYTDYAGGRKYGL